MCTYTYSDSRNQDQDSRMHMGLMKINGTSFPEEEATGGMEDERLHHQLLLQWESIVLDLRPSEPANFIKVPSLSLSSPVN